jgi:hypothetical protein
MHLSATKGTPIEWQEWEKAIKRAKVLHNVQTAKRGNKGTIYTSFTIYFREWPRVLIVTSFRNVRGD